MPSSDTESAAAMEEGGANDILLKPTQGAAIQIIPMNSDGPATPMMGDHIPTLIETPEERKARRRSHYVVYFTAFIGSVAFSIVLTGVWPYLQELDASTTKEYLGWVIAANPFGQIITAPILGFWANKAGSSRGPLLLAILILILGNILYSVLSLFGSASRALMIFARFLVGVSFANMAIIRAYVAASTTTAERTTAVALTSASQGAGFIIGPGLQAMIALAFGEADVEDSNTTVIGDVEEVNHIEWNMYTSAGWIAALLGAVNFFLFLPCVFKEYPVAAKEAQLQKNAAKETNKEIPDPDYMAVFAILLSFFIVQFVFVLIEVVLVPMCIDMYAWSDSTALTIIGIGMCVAGILATIMFGSVGPLAKRFDERKVYILLGLVPLLISMICFIPMGNTYPKMQNCTVGGNESIHREERSIHTSRLPYHLEVVKKQLHPMTYIARFEDDYVGYDYPVQNSVRYMQELYAAEGNGSFKGSMMLESLPILSRQRRRIRRERKCNDLGCPPEQEWCKYTPIIEQSQMIVACTLAFIGYPVAFTLSSSLYSKLLGPKPQGTWMGILTSVSSFSRMTGPIFVTYMYMEVGITWTFGLLIVIVFLTILLTLAFYKRLVPMKVT